MWGLCSGTECFLWNLLFLFFKEITNSHRSSHAPGKFWALEGRQKRIQDSLAIFTVEIALISQRYQKLSWIFFCNLPSLLYSLSNWEQHLALMNFQSFLLETEYVKSQALFLYIGFSKGDTMSYSDRVLSSSTSPPFKRWILKYNIFPWIGLGLLPQWLLCSLVVISGASGTQFYCASRHLFTGNHPLAGARWLLSSPVQTSSSVKSSGKMGRWASLVHHQPETSVFH